MEPVQTKPLFWMGSSRKVVRGFPKKVRQGIGFALFQAQRGGKHISARPLKGFGGASVLEVVEDFDGNTYRAMYTVRFAGAVYVLHAFQKKSKSGIKTSPSDLALVKARLKKAKEHHEARQQGSSKNGQR